MLPIPRLTLEEAASPGFAMDTPPECASAPEPAVVATSEALDRSRSPEVRQRPASDDQPQQR